jgi:hypothetical protein
MINYSLTSYFNAYDLINIIRLIIILKFHDCSGMEWDKKNDTNVRQLKQYIYMIIQAYLFKKQLWMVRD